MKNYKIILEYDGTRYNGWQKQKNTPNTIQEKLEEVLKKMTGHKVDVFGSGRTDAGVHALAQVANFKIDTQKTPGEIKSYLNSYLPKDIKINDIKEADYRFHSRLNAKRKTYIYRLYTGEKPSVFERKFMYSEKIELDLDAMLAAKANLIGEKDFKAFSSIKKTKKSTIRTIYSIEITKNQDEIKFVFNGNGFLHNMVRIIVGTLVDVGLGKISPEYISEIIKKRDRQLAGKTIAPCGLFLENVEY